MGKILQGIKTYVVGTLILFALAFGFYRGCREQTYKISALGMDDIGRKVFAQTLDMETKDSDVGVSIYTEGFHDTVLVVSLKNSAVFFGSIDIEGIADHMRQSYLIALENIEGLFLRGDELKGSMEDPVPIEKIKEKLKTLAAVTIGDFYAACGFNKFVVRIEKRKEILLELIFSNEKYGYNPVLVRRKGASS